jgi:hypothetical protein
MRAQERPAEPAPAPQQPHPGNHPGHHAGPGNPPDQRATQDRLVSRRRARHRSLSDPPAQGRKRRLTVRQFFRFARAQKPLVDPTRGLIAKGAKGFRGKTLTLDQQRELFRRWTTDELVHPHEALVGILALLHGASSSEVRLLQVTKVDQLAQTIRLGNGLTPFRWTRPPGRAAAMPIAKSGRLRTRTSWSPKEQRPGEACLNFLPLQRS